MHPKTEEFFVKMLLDGYEGMIGKRLQEANALECLGMLSTRMLFASGVLDAGLLDRACLAALNREIGMVSGLRDDLEKMYGRADDLAGSGVTFHTEQ